MSAKKKKNNKIKKSTEAVDEKIIDEDSLSKKVNDSIDETFDNKNNKKVKDNKHILTNIVLCILLIVSLIVFVLNIINKNTSINTIISSLIITLFSILYSIIGITYHRKNKLTILISGLLLLVYFGLSIFDNTTPVNSISSVKNFVGKDLAYVVKWASKNNITLNQDYEYSDMIEEYKIISQDIPFGTKLKDISDLRISISEGPNPYKEIVVPSMLTWDAERVINYVEDNHMSNVIVEFVSSDKVKDTVIEQSKSGNLRRDDELKITFSYGEELGFEEVKLIDFTNMSKFRIEFYMKQNQLNYDFNDDFSNKIKRDYGIKQSIEAGKTVHINGDRITVTLSKGPEIKVPDTSKMSITELTEWAVKNRIKLEFIDKYDDSVKEGEIISIDKNTGDIIEQRSTIKVSLSRGRLKMPKFNSYDDFKSWADKYEIKYEEKREFNSRVKSGEVISYSYKSGDTIKNGDTIIVTISDGEKVTVPNLKGLTKNEAINKLKRVGLNYSFRYQASNSTKDTVISQSISSGSEVSSGTTISVTLSSGKNSSNNNNSNNNNNNNNNNSNTNNNPHTNPDPEPSNPPQQVCNSCMILRSYISSAIDGKDSCGAAKSALINSLQSKCPGLKVNVSCVDKDGYDTNDIIQTFIGETNSCSTVNYVLAN